MGSAEIVFRFLLTPPSTRAVSACRPAFLHYSCFLAAVECGLGDRGCVCGGCGW
ncbi:hypothetical protein B9Z19DRAFT_1077715 [Tuber borchii]|uniref:Uncharacterized protein n=1 Tax=Tuber borchii TaxID=42251 RepID=A0A2T7A0B3_TUBBO|nr:hypothetical protein B9Z19DRAFT_1077715 [Tuber borchii]